MEREDLVQRVRDVVGLAPDEVLAVHLYGSRARGTSSPASDVDLGVLLRSAELVARKSDHNIL